MRYESLRKEGNDPTKILTDFVESTEPGERAAVMGGGSNDSVDIVCLAHTLSGEIERDEAEGWGDGEPESRLGDVRLVGVCPSRSEVTPALECMGHK